MLTRLLNELAKALGVNDVWDSGDKPVESVSYFRQIGADVTSIAI